MIIKEVTIKNKLDVLTEIAEKLNKNHIRWNLGASCMLYLRNIVKDFHDIDILIHEEDIDKVKTIMESYTMISKSKDPEKYRTKEFLNYEIRGVDIDIMARFSIVSDGITHEFPLTEQDINEYVTIKHTKIYLSSIKDWYHYYTLMKRKDKIKLLEEFMKKYQN